MSASDIAIGAVLLTYMKTVQTPIYYVSRTLTDAKNRYSMLEKLVLALVYVARRLRGYFQGHLINILMGYKLKSVLSRHVLSRRLAKWAIELVPLKQDKVWSLFTDGASSGVGSGVGLRLVSIEGHEFMYTINFDFKGTNNEAEYEAFLEGLRIAEKLGVRHLEARVVSMLIAGQINGSYEAMNQIMASYLSQEKELILQFASCKVVHSKRIEDKLADALSKLASTSFEHLARDVRIEVLDRPTVPQHQVFVI
ncbi:uncharacterized protein LOC143605189 [Bidens hawaiensis]|uniref:uncharacterized protein LOC143605189 n=1 Tax=Bidens hawaiensis TaxID=980011 RepID=UPI00404B1941